MPAAPVIRILASENNRRGDLFGRLVADLFVALGYEQPRLNVHKSGREIDLSASHRLEPRRAIAECKATSAPIGGDDLNKLLGVREREHGSGAPVVAYFVSLAGFTETAIEQERTSRSPIVLLDSAAIVEELVAGRILVSRERAADVAGHCRPAGKPLTLDPDLELLGHPLGWIWAVCYTEGKARTHVALIHSDGTPLARSLADEVIDADRERGGRLHTLACLNPLPASETGDALSQQEARAAWREAIVSDCGYIHLDGLPADAEAGSKRLLLESLFVPLYLDVPTRAETIERKTVGTVLASRPRLALLGAPGAGKSTLLKRIAVAYADPERRAQSDDALPARTWLPLFIRCRELGSLARGSFADLMQALAQREGVRPHAPAFLKLVDAALLAGRVILLVDGLDEIADPGDRAAFVATLRATLLAHPRVAAVITSREAGFRHVASHLAAICTETTLSAFDDEDVRRLTVSWHREVAGDSEKVRADAEALAASIRGNDRIRQLAANPLLLTTLLLVKRWVGSLPTRRAVLYGKAVEVLLMTWNVEGHKPIPTEEALPQLCYVASTMMLEGIQKISRPKLAAAIRAARRELDTELGYAAGTVAEFIQRIEERSSLLMMTGHDVENGELVEFFEFRHLTFQEYLTAKAMVEGWHPGRAASDTLASVLAPHLGTLRWREVIQLAAVIGGKASDALIDALATLDGESRLMVEGTRLPYVETLGYSVRAVDRNVLLGCLADEAPARPATIRAAIAHLVKLGSIRLPSPAALTLARGRYAADLIDEASTQFFAASGDLRNTSDALAVATLGSRAYRGLPDLAREMLTLLKSDDILERCGGALVLGRYAGHISFASGDLVLDDGITAIQRMLRSEHVAEVFAAVTGAGIFGRRDHPDTARLAGALFAIWRSNPRPDLSARAAHVLVQPAIHKRQPDWAAAFPESEVRTLLEHFGDSADLARAVTLTTAWYTRAVDDAVLADLCHGTVKLELDESFRVASDLLEWLESSPERARATSTSSPGPRQAS